MEKQQLISLIKESLASGNLSKEDLLNITGKDLNKHDPSEPSRNLIHIFYGIGAIIAIIGIVILIVQNWYEIGFFGRILVTLGIALVTYMAGFLLNKPEQNAISQVMFIIATVLAPIGSYVLLKEGNINFDSATQAMTAVILAAIFGAALFTSKKNILTLITIGFATWAYYALITKAFGANMFYNSVDFLKWSTIIVGTAYLFMAYGLKSFLLWLTQNHGREEKIIQDVLYGFGTLAILGGGIALGGIFDVIFIAVVFGAFYGSVYLKSRSMLILGAIFLVAHIIKLTSKYFVNSSGWSIALIIVGFLVIGIGYLTYYLNKKYISA